MYRKEFRRGLLSFNWTRVPDPKYFEQDSLGILDLGSRYILKCIITAVLFVRPVTCLHHCVTVRFIVKVRLVYRPQVCVCKQRVVDKRGSGFLA